MGFARSRTHPPNRRVVSRLRLPPKRRPVQRLRNPASVNERYTPWTNSGSLTRLCILSNYVVILSKAKDLRSHRENPRRRYKKQKGAASRAQQSLQSSLFHITLVYFALSVRFRRYARQPYHPAPRPSGPLHGHTRRPG